MEITNALLVAMMFIVLITMGVGNIIMGLAVLLDKRTPVKADIIHTSWVLLLLLIHFNLFWHVLDILSIDEWKFLEFIYIVAGAMLVFFATHVLLPDPSSADAGDLRAHYFNSSRQFFSFLALLQVWTLGVDFLFGDGFIFASVFNLAALVLFGILALTSQPKVQSIGTAAGWLLFLTVLIARGLGLLS
jgi:hypothetical protein